MEELQLKYVEIVFDKQTPQNSWDGNKYFKQNR